MRLIHGAKHPSSVFTKHQPSRKWTGNHCCIKWNRSIFTRTSNPKEKRAFNSFYTTGKGVNNGISVNSKTFRLAWFGAFFYFGDVENRHSFIQTCIWNAPAKSRRWSCLRWIHTYKQPNNHRIKYEWKRCLLSQTRPQPVDTETAPAACASETWDHRDVFKSALGRFVFQYDRVRIPEYGCGELL